MTWLTLAPLAAVLSATALLSYSPAGRASPWFYPAVVASSVASAVLWCWACRHVGGGRELFTLSLAWDALTLVCYSLVPLAAFGIRLSSASWVGLGLVVLGAVVVKLGE